MPQFHDTGYGHRFFEKQLPDLIKGLNRVADALEGNNESKEIKPGRNIEVINENVVRFDVVFKKDGIEQKSIISLKSTFAINEFAHSMLFNIVKEHVINTEQVDEKAILVIHRRD